MNDNVEESAIVLASLVRHQKHLEANIEKLIGELSYRAKMHDQSKLSKDEFSGFVNIHNVARNNPIGSPEYEASMRTATCIQRHFTKNSHHPEYHSSVEDMGWLDIIEMVLDWKAAADTYGMVTVRDSLDYQFNRHKFTSEQKWLINQVLNWIDRQS